MVDNTIPTNQFHPYQPPEATPHSELPGGVLNNLLRKAGIDRSRLGSMQNMNVQHSIEKARGYAQQNPGKVLGGLAALAIGLGVMRGRRLR